MKTVCLCTLYVCLTVSVFAQDIETEFEAGFSHHFELGVGARDVWQYKHPRRYFNSLQYAPTFTLPGNWFRIAPMIGAMYPGNEINFVWGLKSAYRIQTGNLNGLGSLYNIHLVAEGWRNEGSYLFGGGVGAELGQLVTVSFKNLYHTESNEIWSMLSMGVVLYPRKQKGSDANHYTPSP